MAAAHVFCGSLREGGKGPFCTSALVLKEKEERQQAANGRLLILLMNFKLFSKGNDDIDVGLIAEY
jgi:hypothetical protein